MRRHELTVNLLLAFGPFAVGLAALVLLTTMLTILLSLACFVTGLVLLVYAKYNLFQRGIWVSFGTAQMHVTASKAYLQAYGFIVIGVATTLIAQLTFYGAR